MIDIIITLETVAAFSLVFANDDMSRDQHASGHNGLADYNASWGQVKLFKNENKGILFIVYKNFVMVPV